MSNLDPVFICGAGPTGLVLALWLHQLQIPFRIIDKATSPGQTSRAMVVHARILEFYRQLGVSDRIVAAGSTAQQMVFSRLGQPGAAITFQDAGKGISKFPFVLSLPQDEHEAVLNEVLEERGIKIERGVELLGAVQNERNVQVSIRHVAGANEGKEESNTASYLVGCDGAHSAVRHLAGIKMEGGTYDQRFFVSDVDIDPSTPLRAGHNLNMNISPVDFCMVIPFKRERNIRIIGFVPKDKLDHENITIDDVKPTIHNATGLEIEKVIWFNTYNVHHRAADKFRSGRLFLCGDACHLHSPMGGQGMNTGIGDATNLAWKLASVLRGTAPPKILDTYDPERSEFAHRLVNTTDTAFNLVTGEGWIGWFGREVVMRYILPFFIGFSWYRTFTWRTLSQVLIEYPHSALSVKGTGASGSVRPGVRLPYVEDAKMGQDNFAALKECWWQVHVYGEGDAKAAEKAKEKGVNTHIFPWNAQVKATGLVRNSIYVVRPDGYLGWVGAKGDVEGLAKYLLNWVSAPVS